MKKTFNRNTVTFIMFMMLVVALPLGSLIATQNISNQKSAVELRQKYSEYSWAENEDNETLNDIKSYIVTTANTWLDDAKEITNNFINNPKEYFENNIK